MVKNGERIIEKDYPVYINLTCWVIAWFLSPAIGWSSYRGLTCPLGHCRPAELQGHGRTAGFGLLT